jgi:hypothetical protein
MESVSRRSVIAGAAGAAAVGLASQVLGQESKERSAEQGGQDCLCVLQIPNLKLSDMKSRGDDKSRDLIGTLIGVLAPVIVDEIIKATRSRSGDVATSGCSVGAKDLSSKRDGSRGVDDEAMRSLFGGSFSGPGIKIGVVVG